MVSRVGGWRVVPSTVILVSEFSSYEACKDGLFWFLASPKKYGDNMWMYRKLGIDRGPIDDKKIISLIKQSVVKSNTLVQHARFTQGGWVKAGTVTVLAKVMRKLEHEPQAAGKEQATETPEPVAPPPAAAPPVLAPPPGPVTDDWVEIENSKPPAPAFVAPEPFSPAPVPPPAPAPVLPTSVPLDPISAPLVSPAPPGDPYEVNPGVYVQQYEETNVDTQFLLDHGTGLKTIGFWLAIALFVLLGVLPLVIFVFVGLRTGTLNALSVGTGLLGTTAAGVACYFFYYWMRLMGSLFRVFAHIESNTRRSRNR